VGEPAYWSRRQRAENSDPSATPVRRVVVDRAPKAAAREQRERVQVLEGRERATGTQHTLNRVEHLARRRRRQTGERQARHDVIDGLEVSRARELDQLGRRRAGAVQRREAIAKLIDERGLELDGEQPIARTQPLEDRLGERARPRSELDDDLRATRLEHADHRAPAMRCWGDRAHGARMPKVTQDQRVLAPPDRQEDQPCDAAGPTSTSARRLQLISSRSVVSGEPCTT
jgi:hypothetical protein